MDDKTSSANIFNCDVIKNHWYLCGKVVTELETLEKGRHDNRGEEKNDTPEEDIRDVGTIGATCAADKLPALFNTVLRHQVEVRTFDK